MQQFDFDDAHYFLSASNPVANLDQREMEDRALRLVERPEIAAARSKAAHLFREVWQHAAGAQLPRIEAMLDEYVFHYAMRTTASDGNYPGVVRFMTPPHHWFGRDVPGSRWGGDSPDFCYRIIPVDYDGYYEIYGRPTCQRPPTVHYALMSANTAAPTIMGLLDGLDIQTATDGSFTIFVDPEPAAGRANHIQLRPGALQIWIRDAMGDWVDQSPNALRVKRLNPPTRGPLSDEELAQRMAQALVDGVYYNHYICQAIIGRPPNQMSKPMSSAAMGGMASQYTCSAHIMLEPDEALIVTSTSAGALFRNAVPADVFMLSLDYWNRLGSLNSSQMEPDDDGLFTYVVAHQDPGVHNWLDTNGLQRLIFGQRWQSFPAGAASVAPTMVARKAKFSDLVRELPPGIRRVDAIQRARQLADRRAGFDRRFIDR